jgi:hypothetical protein
MTMAQELELPIGFADSELKGYRRVGTVLSVEIHAWNDKHVEVSFRDVIGVRDSLAGSFSDFVQDSPASASTLKDALARNFESVPAFHPYCVYSFLNLEEEPSLEIVASSCEITVR